MRVLAATFSDREAAAGVLRELRVRYELGPEDAAVAPLGTTGASNGLTLLAGRFYDERVQDIKQLIERHGGQIVADIDKQWTDPWPRLQTEGSPRRELTSPRVGAEDRPT